MYILITNSKVYKSFDEFELIRFMDLKRNECQLINVKEFIQIIYDIEDKQKRNDKIAWIVYQLSKMEDFKPGG